jgi:hypothetical protein
LSHVNTGSCQKCLDIMNRYVGFNAQLKSWFCLVQAKHWSFHCADAGRGKVEQETYFARGASRAQYGQSSHNFNVGLDTFFLVEGEYSLDKKLYALISPEIPKHIVWYGAPGAKFYELPHFELADWRGLLIKGLVKLVE